MMVNGKMGRSLERAPITIHLGILILVIGLMIKKMGKAHTFTLLARSTLETGKMIKSMVLELPLMVKEILMRVTIRKIKEMAKGPILLKAGISTKVNFLMERNMAKEYLPM